MYLTISSWKACTWKLVTHLCPVLLCYCILMFFPPPIYSFQISTNRRWAWFTNGLPGIEMIQLSSCGLHFHLIVQIGNCMLYTICWHVTEKVGRQNENPHNPETKEMNVDECIRGRLLWQTWTNVVNHAALCITKCCTQDREGNGKGESLAEISRAGSTVCWRSLRKIIRGLWRRKRQLSFHFHYQTFFTMIFTENTH